MLTLAFRVLWQWKPNLLTCAVFWGVAIGCEVVSICRHPQTAWRYTALLGASCNALVTLANGGLMPVLGLHGSPMAVWVKATSSHRLLWLADRFWGFSVGDFFIIGGLLSSLAYWLYGKATV